MMKYIDLSVSLQKIPEDGLRDFKSITANTAASSMGNVVRHFLLSASEKVAAAQGKLDEALKVVDDVDDLESVNSPEE